MTNRVNKAFEKWYSEALASGYYIRFDYGIAKLAYQAATQASESEINSLKERVAELQSHLSSQSIEIANNDVTLESYAHKVAELQASNNRLREALEKTLSRPKLQNEIDNILSSTPAQSLAERKEEYEGKLMSEFTDPNL